MKILQKGEKILEEKAKEIALNEIKSDKIQNLIKEMLKTTDATEDGVALAAPQIGESLRIFVVSEKAFKNEKTINLVYINPEITKLSKKTEWLEEGCLSVAGVFGEVKRSTNCVVSAYDENGNKFERGAGGLLAQIFQHEVDHLNGILFISKAKDLRKI